MIPMWMPTLRGAARRPHAPLALCGLESRLDPDTVVSTVVLTSSVLPSAPGQAVTFTATATYDGGLLGQMPATGGEISLTDDSNGGASLGQGSLTFFTNKLTVTTAALTPGDHVIRAHFTGYNTTFDTATPADATFTQTVLPAGPALTLAPATLPTAVVGEAYSQPLTPSGRPGPFTYALASAPKWLTVAADGTLGGTPLVAGAANFQVLVTEGSGATTTYQERIFVSQTTPVVITPATLPNGQAGVAYRQVLTASGPPGPFTFSLAAGTLPPGLTLTPDGVLSGTRTTAGGSAFSVTATAAGGGTGSQPYALSFTPAGVSPPPVVPPTSPPASPPPPATSPASSPALVGRPQTAVGVAGGGVRVLTPGGSLASASTPFPGFTGEVRTAAGANGTVAAGTGPGRPTQVKLYDPFTGVAAFDAAPFEAAFTGGVFVSTGDLFGTGTPDVVVSPDEGGGPRVQIRDGVTGAVRADFFGIDDPAFRGGARTAVADVTGDGVPDLIVAAGFGGGPRVTIFDGRSIRGGSPAPVANFFVFEPTLRNGVYVAAGDLNGDGYADLIVGGGPGGGPRVFAESGRDIAAGSPQPSTLANFFAGDPGNRGGVRVAVKDLDGDGRADLVAAPGPGGGNAVKAYAGKAIAPDGTPATLFSFDDAATALNGAFVG